MAGISAFPSLNSACRRNSISSHPLSSSNSSNLLIRRFRFQRIGGLPGLRTVKWNRYTEARKIRVVAEETLAPEVDSQAQSEESVAVPVSPSDILTMFLQAEGTLEESAIPTVTQALEGIEGIADLKVEVIEGIASVELTKQTTIQATGVASNLVEVIQGSGFKLQTLNLSFEDEEDSKK